MPVLIDRPKMTVATYQALKRHIMREREKKKQEQEHDALVERLKKERELQKKKQEEDNLTLEQIKDQIGMMESKHESLKNEKHELFSQLKKVLHQEDETRRRAQLKEQSELLNFQHPYTVTGHPMLLHPGVTGRPTLYKPHQPLIPIQQRLQGMKRTRSPSPPVTVYQPYPNEHKYPQTSYAITTKQPAVVYTPSQAEYKPTTYGQNQPPPQVAYASQGTHAYQQQAVPFTAGPPTTKYTTTPTVASQSAFTSYPGHYPQQQKPLTESYPHNYQLQRMPQTTSRQGREREYKAGYLNTAHSSALPLQQQLEHANQKSGFSDEKFKMQTVQQQHIRGITPITSQQQTLMARPLQIQQNSQPKGSIVTGYSGRGSQPQPQHTTVSSYQPVTTQATYSGHQAAGRPQAYTSQQPPNRFY
ncbi:G protein pathway suppressor 2 isoform X1 [Octopus sinensis]|uniref:G protein pathway suppressor 2 isoform X1 n=1 Tax=Octopus sinensis TaxID=2607531 RepID=A0A6P7T951_9MOLL|nr:G protein pathway suppressor 2 isoform X1 [Octopus sinensis]